MKIEGAIKLIGNEEQVGSNGFRKRDIVVTTLEQYPQHISIQFVQDKCDLLNAFTIGQNVEIGINLRGREWVSPQGETKYFNTVQGWRIQEIANQTPTPLPPTNENYQGAEQEGDLPF